MLEEARNDLLFYTQACNPNYIASKFHVFLAKKLQQVAAGKIKRLIINTPPRHGKSQMVSVEFPTWLLGNHPEKKIVLSSYAQDLSMSHSKMSRARMQSEEYQAIFDTRIADGEAAANEWKTARGGMYKAVGVGGGLTGRGADCLLIDDPTKDFQEAHSATIRENVWNWFWSVAYTRLHPGAAVVILMTRWHTDDLVGRLLEPERIKAMEVSDEESRWEVINLPAMSHGDGDVLGRPHGEALFPERYPVDRLKSIKASVGSYVWSALYDGNPVVRGGNYIPVGNLQIVDAAPDGLRWVRFWDLATSEKKTSDHTSSIAAAFGPDGMLYLRDWIDGQWEWPVARSRIKQTAELERIPIGVEAVAGFKTAFANLIEVLPPYITCREYGADKDKLTRALPWIAMVDRSKVSLVRAEWNMDFIMQAEQFPAGKLDDGVDSVSGCWQMLQTVFNHPVPINVHDRLRAAMTQRRTRALVG